MAMTNALASLLRAIDAAVFICEDYDRPAFQARTKYPIAGDIKVIAVDQREQGHGSAPSVLLLCALALSRSVAGPLYRCVRGFCYLRIFGPCT
jgi:hypothetical protein